MGFWIFMTICNLLIPIVMIGFGWLLKKHPPKNINGIYGYRTSMSMKNMDTWKFAHEYCGKLWWKIGWMILPISIITMMLCMKSSKDIIGTVGGVVSAIQCVLLIVSIFPVEKALKKNFDKNGMKRFLRS